MAHSHGGVGGGLLDGAGYPMTDAPTPTERIDALEKSYKLWGVLGPHDPDFLLPYARLGAWTIERSREDWGDIDGGELQDRAVELGILVEVTVTEPCDPDFCQCAEFDDFPQTCLRYAAAAEKVNADE
jgi:hypothetical protein